MKRPACCCLVFICAAQIASAQNVGIGTTTPQNKLHVIDTTAIPATLGYFNLHTSAGPGFTTALHGEISGSGTGTYYGVYGTSLNSNNGITVGTVGETYGGNSGDKIGLEGLAYGSTGTNYGTRGWGFGSGAEINYGIFGAAFGGTTNWAGYFAQGNVFMENNVGIGISDPHYKVDASGSTTRTGSFVNNVTNEDYVGLFASCDQTPNYGYGLSGNGGWIGVEGNALLSGPGSRTGVSGNGQGGETNFGVNAISAGGNLAYGVFAKADLATTKYAGYFSGNVFSTGSYLPSDRKLKDNIVPLNNALGIIQNLHPATYTYKVKEYEQMQLPTGLQYGLIADEVQEVMPGAIKKAIQPAEYADRNPKATKLTDAVEFNAVNYTEMIPVLIAAMKEQQVLILEQQKKIENLEERLSRLEKK